MASLLVEPVAYNYKGVGYKNICRRTIERMNDVDSIIFLLNRFSGNDLSAQQKLGVNKLNENTILTQISPTLFE